MKRLFFAFLALFWLGGGAFAQGTLPIALQQSVNANGQPLAGALLYTYVVGTVATPQNTFQDSGLTIANPWPLQADQNGRLPMFYMASGSTHVRLTDSTGLVQFDYPSMLVIGASGGGGGGGTVDPTTILQTGDEKIRYGTGTLAGFVRENGLTIGSAVSGATERANADTQNLFVYLYNTDPNLVVSGGRTGNALNDFNANKTIVLPDMRGRVSAGLDGMGNALAGRIGSGAGSFGANNNTLGAAGGAEVHTLTVAQLPSITSSASNSITVTGPSGHTMSIDGTVVSDPGTGGAGNHITNAALGTGTFTGSNSISVTSTGTTGSAHDTMAPAMLKTVYIKL